MKDPEFLIKTLEWLKASLERTPAENRRINVRNSRHWGFKTRMTYLFQTFLSDLWIIPFSRIKETPRIYCIGLSLIYLDIKTLTWEIFKHN